MAEDCLNNIFIGARNAYKLMKHMSDTALRGLVMLMTGSEFWEGESSFATCNCDPHHTHHTHRMQ